jgi:hypothetical protein
MKNLFEGFSPRSQREKTPPSTEDLSARPMPFIILKIFNYFKVLKWTGKIGEVKKVIIVIFLT